MEGKSCMRDILARQYLLGSLVRPLHRPGEYQLAKSRRGSNDGACSSRLSHQLVSYYYLLPGNSRTAKVTNEKRLPVSASNSENMYYKQLMGEKDS